MPRSIDVGRVTFKYGLGEEFIDVLRTLHLLGLDSTKPVLVRGVRCPERMAVVSPTMAIPTRIAGTRPLVAAIDRPTATLSPAGVVVLVPEACRRYLADPDPAPATDQRACPSDTNTPLRRGPRRLFGVVPTPHRVPASDVDVLPDPRITARRTHAAAPLLAGHGQPQRFEIPGRRRDSAPAEVLLTDPPNRVHR